MLNTDWSKLSPQQLGAYGEIFVKMCFLSYGMDVYSSEVDDHGVDLVIKDKKKRFQEIQVKSVYKGNYVFVKKRMMLDENTGMPKENYFVCLIRFVQNEEPLVYLIPSSAWNNPDGVLLVSRDYPGGKSEPEFGVNVTKKSMPLLEKYEITTATIKLYFE